MINKEPLVAGLNLVKVQYLVLKMEDLKVHIRHIMPWEFKRDDSAAETVRKIRRVY